MRFQVIYNTFKSLGLVRFLFMFLKENTVKQLISEILLQVLQVLQVFFFFTLIHFKMSLILVMAQLNFQQPLLQSSVSHDPSEIILI